MEIIDFRLKYKSIYQPKVGIVEFGLIPPMKFLMIDGHGNPNTSQDYADSVSALYSIAYTLKFKIKKTRAIDYNLLALEGLWWGDDMNLFSTETKDQWKWTMMIAQPDFIAQADITAAIDEAGRKKPNPALARIRFEVFDEGQCVQIMHIGPYAAEKPNIDLLHQAIADKGYKRSGKHHEIYLGDPRKSAPEKLKTIIRQPYE
jgi:hypothetical protein